MLKRIVFLSFSFFFEHSNDLMCLKCPTFVLTKEHLHLECFYFFLFLLFSSFSWLWLLFVFKWFVVWAAQVNGDALTQRQNSTIVTNYIFVNKTQHSEDKAIQVDVSNKDSSRVDWTMKCFSFKLSYFKKWKLKIPGDRKNKFK